MDNHTQRLFGITGWKNSGKTTLVSRLVQEFTSQGFIISTVKHAHDGFAIDHEGTDTHKHQKAGAQETVILSDNRFAIMHSRRADQERPTLEAMLAKLAPCDLVLIEGFKTHPFAKIECRRTDAQKDAPIWKNSEHIVALASQSGDPACPLPQFDLDDVKGIAQFIAQKTGLLA